MTTGKQGFHEYVLKRKRSSHVGKKDAITTANFFLAIYFFGFFFPFMPLKTLQKIGRTFEENGKGGEVSGSHEPLGSEFWTFCAKNKTKGTRKINREKAKIEIDKPKRTRTQKKKKLTNKKWHKLIIIKHKQKQETHLNRYIWRGRCIINTTARACTRCALVTSQKLLGDYKLKKKIEK